MTDELKFDVKTLQAMQVPLSVRAVALRGDTQMPLNIRAGSMSQNQAAGTGYTREEVMELEQTLGKTFGGGHYEVGVVDANQRDMKWRFMLDPNIFPGPRHNTPPPQIPMGSGQQPQQAQPPQQPPLGTGYPQAQQQYQNPQYQNQQPGGAQVNPPGVGGAYVGQQPGNWSTQGPNWQPYNPSNPGYPGQPPSPPWYPSYPPPYWPPPAPAPSAPNNQVQEDTRILRMEMQHALSNLTNSFREDMRAFSDKAAASNQKADFSGFLDLAKLAIPFIPQAINFFANRPSKEDPASAALKEELRGLRESMQRQDEKRAHDAERQQMLQTVEQIQGSTLKQLEDLKGALQDKASSAQVGVLDRVIEAFRGISADKPIPQGLQLADVVSLVTLMKDNGGNGADLRGTLSLFRELAETFSGGGEPSIWPKALEHLSGVATQVVQARALQQMQGQQRPPQPVHYNPQTMPVPQQIPASAEGLSGAPQTAARPLDAVIVTQLRQAVRDLQINAQLFVESNGKTGLAPQKAAEATKEAADKLRALNFKIDLRTLFESAKFGELAVQILGIGEKDMPKWQTYLEEFIATLEELTQMEAVDFGVEEEDEVDANEGDQTPVEPTPAAAPASGKKGKR